MARATNMRYGFVSITERSTAPGPQKAQMERLRVAVIDQAEIRIYVQASNHHGGGRISRGFAHERSRVGSNPLPAPPAPAAAPPPAVAPAAPDLNRMDRDARDALNAARSAVDAYVRTAQDEVERQLAADPNYRAAQDQTIAQQRRLDDVRTYGRREAIHLAERDYNDALDREHRLRDAAYASNGFYQQAKALSAQLVSPPPDPTATRIADAIAEHRLVVGMTLDEAMRAMGPDMLLLDSTPHVTHYRWKVMGHTGDVVEVHHDGFHRREVLVPQYGVVGHVTATFTDGRITDVFQDRN